MKIKRIIMQQPASIGGRFPDRLIDVSMPGVISIRLVDSGVEVVLDGEDGALIIPLSNIAVMIPLREPCEEKPTGLVSFAYDQQKRKGKK
jgi:hypothetical protein